MCWFRLYTRRQDAHRSADIDIRCPMSVHGTEMLEYLQVRTWYQWFLRGISRLDFIQCDPLNCTYISLCLLTSLACLWRYRLHRIQSPSPLVLLYVRMPVERLLCSSTRSQPQRRRTHEAMQSAMELVWREKFSFLCLYRLPSSLSLISGRLKHWISSPNAWLGDLPEGVPINLHWLNDIR